MDERALPSFEDVVHLDDARVQCKLAPAADPLIAAAIHGAPAAVAIKILSNLSKARVDSVNNCAERHSDRTRVVARRVLVSLLWDLPAAEPEAPKQDYADLMKLLAAQNPEIRRKRRAAFDAAVVRSVLHA